MNRENVEPQVFPNYFNENSTGGKEVVCIPKKRISVKVTQNEKFKSHPSSVLLI